MSRSRDMSYCRPSCSSRLSGFTLADAVVGICIATLLAGSALAQIGGAREAASRTKCADNLKQIGQAALLYANQSTGAFPRTYYNAANPKVIVDTTGYGKANSFDRDSTGDNNVPASFFLILKTQEITPEVFVCGGAGGEGGFGPGSKVGVQDSSNWAEIPKNLSYSYSCPFPTKEAIGEGWKFNKTLGETCPLAADMNPGNEELLKVLPNSSRNQMKPANSRNHGGEGQNVLYADGHVDYQNTPFCGAESGAGKPRDNIYTFGPSDTKGGTGIVGEPTTAQDAVLLPTDGRGTAGAPARQAPKAK